MCHCVINYKIYLSSFSILKIGAVRHIRLSKLKNLTLRQMLGPICITVPNFIKIGRTVAEMWRFNGFYRAMLCMRGTSHGPVSVCLSVCLCLCLKSVSVTSRCSTKTAKRRITQTKPHDSSRNLVFWSQRSQNFTEATRMGTPNAGGVGQNRRLSTNNRLYLENGKR